MMHNELAAATTTATPQPKRFMITPPSSSKPLSLTPGSRVLQSPLSDEAIWIRLKEAGFDEESIKRRDKAALIAYIAKLEAEIFDHQHQMGLLLLERKELNFKYEQVKDSAEAAEIMYKRDRGAHSSALAEARKREETLKKALGVEKECVASLEKALHEMRAESAETKVAVESKLLEAGIMVEDAQKKFTEAEVNMHAAESLQAEAKRFHGAAERKLKEVESREDDLRRRILSFKSDCEVKEKEIDLERQSWAERQKILLQEQKQLLDQQALLNEREDYIFNKSQDLKRLEKELEASKENIEKELRALNNEKSNLELNITALSEREEIVNEREAIVCNKEKELLVLQEKFASKESEEVKKLIADNETVIRLRKSKFEAELEMKRKLVEDEIETKRRACELRELDLCQREDLLLEREHNLEVQLRALTEKEKDVADRLNLLNERENSLIATEREVELKQAILQQEKEDTSKMKLELQISLGSLEDKKKQVDYAKEELEVIKSETNELSVLEMKLKEEIDMVRAEKLELMVEADKLKVEKAKFEAEWELIDEKREELKIEVTRVAEEKQAVMNFISDERESLRLEKEAMRDQHQRDVDLLHREQEHFMNKMVHERSEWCSKMQQERADFLLDIEIQRRELENCIQKRREELETYLRVKEKAFEQEKKNELQYISSLKEQVAKESELVSLEMKRLENERLEINLDRERREREWTELNSSIEELKMQREKLKQLRELLHAERGEINAQIEQLKKLEDLKFTSDCIPVAEIQQSNFVYSQKNVSAKRYMKQPSTTELDSHKNTDNGNRIDSPYMQKPDASPSSSTRFSWIKRCAELIFKHSPEDLQKYENRFLISDYKDASLALGGQLDSSSEYYGQKYGRSEKAHELFSDRVLTRYALGEPKVILQVPPIDGILRDMNNLVSETKVEAGEKSLHSVFDQGFLAGRKRRVDTPLSDDCYTNSKKRREQKDVTSNSSDHGINQCVLSTQSDALKDQQASALLDQTRNAEETSVLLVDEIMKISEVDCGNSETDNLQTEDKIHHLLNHVVESHEDNLQGRETNGHASLPRTSCTNLPFDSKAWEKIHIEVQLDNIGQHAELNQSKEEDISSKSDKRDQKLKDGGVSMPDNAIENEC